MTRPVSPADANMPPTHVLSLHASYGCRNRGACCTAGWPIPIERANLDRVEEAIADGRLRPPTGVRPLFERRRGAPAETPALLGTAAGRCVFHHPDGASGCDIHRALGHAALPLACRQFPRVSIVDPRGASVTLSHFCPTAAELLEAEVDLRIATNAPAFPAAGEYVGLDVRDALPPLLRPDMLMDWESWWQFERESVALIGESRSSDEALGRLGAAVEQVRTWRPTDGTLGARIADAFGRARARGPAHERADPRTLRVAVWSAIPSDLRPALESGNATLPRYPDGVRVRYLAAHAFANWTAHLGRDLRTWLRSIEAADALVQTGSTIGEADLWLRHLADPEEMLGALR